MQRVLLINDTRSQGLSTAVVMSRVLMRRGTTVIPAYGQDTTRHTRGFWRDYAPTLELDGVDRVVLCGITFDSSDPERCRRILDEFARTTAHRALSITHRWPDGYEDSQCEILVPPFDVVEAFAADLENSERVLLRLGAIASRQASGGLVSAEDLALADALSDAIYDDPTGMWERLAKDIGGTLVRIAAAGKRAPLPSDVTLEQRGDGYVLFRFGALASRRPEKTLERCLADMRYRFAAIGAAIAEFPDGRIRIYLNRPWPRQVLPSLRCLIDRYGEGLEPTQWVGRPDAIHREWGSANEAEESLPAVREHLVAFLRRVGSETIGSATPPVGLLRAVHLVAHNMLERLDLLGQVEIGRDLAFDPGSAEVLIEVGSRMSTRRMTLQLVLRVKSMRAAELMCGYGGFNLQKLEMALGGFLSGIQARRSNWLDMIELPERLRIDTHIEADIVVGLPDALCRLPDVVSEPLDEARRAVAPDSLIARAVKRLSPRGNATVIVFRQSETIGPSVSYALVAMALASSIALHKGEGIKVLDVFAGSGITAMAVLSRQRDWQVFCVDGTVRRSDTALADDANVVWYHGDALEILSRLEQSFDMVCLDPPHAMMLELLFGRRAADGRALVEVVKASAKWLVMYPGHVSQRGRARACYQLLGRHFPLLQMWQVGSELLIVGNRGNDVDGGVECLRVAMEMVKGSAGEYGMSVADEVM